MHPDGCIAVQTFYFAAFLVLARGFHKAGKQRVSITRRRSKLRVELAGHKPRMVRHFDDLDQLIIPERPATRRPAASIGFNNMLLTS